MRKIQRNIVNDKLVEERKSRVKIIDKTLKKLFPEARIALDYGSPWELLVAVQLSAQCTDKKVNEVTPALFRRYPDLDSYVDANLAEFESMVRQTGFFRNKSKNILAAAKVIKNEFGGVLPRTMDEMLTIPGVGRKSANVILGNAYGVVDGIAVDTHVRRLSRLYGLTTNNDPEKIEKDLMEIVPKKDWFGFTYRLIDYGRKYCPARPHDHLNCPVYLALKEFHRTS